MKKNDEKAQKLIKNINGLVTDIVLDLSKQGKLDHFDVSINNHQGNLQVECTNKQRIKVY